MKWYYPEKGELPDRDEKYTECLCEYKMNPDSALYTVLAERYMMLEWQAERERFNDGQGYEYYELDKIKRWCYLDEAISKLDE